MGQIWCILGEFKMVDEWLKKSLAHPIERHYRNLRRTDEEALIMKQYSKEFESCKLFEIGSIE